MPRFFNTAGPCRPNEHYMLPAASRLTEIHDIIDSGSFFVLHAPRQSGKTTLLRNLSRDFTDSGKYAAITVTLEVFTENNPDKMLPRMPSQFIQAAHWQLPEDLRPTEDMTDGCEPNNVLTLLLSRWSAAIDRPLVVFIDEVDAIPGDVRIQVLRQLRAGYTSRPASFPHSVALVGMRDVRDYKVQARGNEETLGTASPFNVKTRSLTLRDFNPKEVEELLKQHTKETGQAFDKDATAEIFEQSKGQPWLTNALAAQLTTDYDALVKDRSTPVTRADVLNAREILIERRDTHLDSLVARLGEDRIKRVIQPVLTGDLVADPTYDDDWSYARDLGLVSIRNGVRCIANPIYQEIIPRILTHQVQTSIPMDPKWYLEPGGTLDMEKMLREFTKFWQRHGEVLLRGMPYHEAAPHLVLMAYLQRVVNGGGSIRRKFALGTLRADLIVELGGREDVIEIKLRRDKHTLPEGLEQTAAYAKRLGRDVGYLVIFDPKSSTPWDERGSLSRVEQEGVTVMLLEA